MTPILEVENLSKSFGGLRALTGLSLSIMPGQILGLIGPNGSGKTTTINILTGLFSASAGCIRLSGEDITARKPEQIVRAGMARTFQNLRLFPTRTVFDNVRAGQHIHSRSWLSFLSAIPTSEERALMHEARALLERFQLCERTTSKAGELSYGDKKRLEIARALASRPRVLLLDEPAAGMNPVEVQWLVEMLKKIRESGVSILLVEHHMKLIMSVCDEITVLNFGSKIAEGSPSQISKNPEVIAAYLGAGH